MDPYMEQHHGPIAAPPHAETTEQPMPSATELGAQACIKLVRDGELKNLALMFLTEALYEQIEIVDTLETKLKERDQTIRRLTEQLAANEAATQATKHFDDRRE